MAAAAHIHQANTATYHTPRGRPLKFGAKTRRMVMPLPSMALCWLWLRQVVWMGKGLLMFGLPLLRLRPMQGLAWVETGGLSNGRVLTSCRMRGPYTLVAS